MRRGPDRPTVSLSDRRAERDGARRRLVLRRVLIGLTAVALVAGAGWALLFSPLTALDSVEVELTEDTAYVEPAEVRAGAEDQLDVPLLRVDTGAVTERVGALPGVAEADVSRSWPSGLRIEVTPRIPVAARPAGEQWGLLDETGAEIAVEAEPPEDLPRVDVPTDPEAGPRALTAVLTALADMPGELRARVVSAAAQSPGAITLQLDDGAEVRWGDAGQSELKSEVLLVLLEQAPASVYDVSVPGSPTTG